MKTKIVYVVVSNDFDIYLEQALLSIHSLRLYMPCAEIILLTDNLTNGTLIGKRKKILDYITSKVVVPFDEEYNNLQRSRLLKTSMREYIDGDFLFIDTDTIITGSFDEIDSFDFDIGAVKELHMSSLKKLPEYLKVRKNINKIGESVDENQIYFNSGVIYVKDNDKTKKFFKIWNKYWRKGNFNGVDLDQPSFVVANMLNNYMISQLPDIWNCQLPWSLKYLYKSKIIHYLASNMPFHEGYLSEFTNKNLYLEIKTKGYIDNKIEQIVKNPYNYFNEYTRIIYDQDTAIWDSFSIRLLRFLYKNHNKLFNIIEIFSKYCFIQKKL
jgi:hypothetical protein